MKDSRLIRPAILIALMALGLLATACGRSAEKMNQEGNDAFAELAYLEALAAYQSAQFESPELAEPYYNAANALYRQEAYPEALEQLKQALSYAEGEALAENSFYNMGNSSFNTQDWEAAVAAFSEALLLNPDDQEAKYNLELALQQLQQQQQEQQQQEQEQEQEENQDQQQEQSESSEGENDQQQQEQDQSQAGENEEQKEPEDGQGQNDQQQQEQDQNQEGDQSENGEDQESEQQEQNQNNGQAQPQSGQNQEDQQPGQVPPPGQRMTAEQAQQLLAAIAQDSETLQERLGQMFVVPPIPPVQDW